MCYITSPASDAWGGSVTCVAASSSSGLAVELPAPSADYGWVQVASGTSHSCAVDAMGRMRCFGGSTLTSRGTEHVWSPPSSFGPIAAVSAGEDFTCVVAKGRAVDGAYVDVGALTCKGSNEDLGAAWSAQKAFFAKNSVLAVSVGSTAVCAVLKADNSLRCFGGGSASRLLTNTPTGAFVQVSVGITSNACGIRASDSHIVCWGEQWSTGSYVYSDAYDSVVVGEDWFCATKTEGNALTCLGMIVPRVFSSYNSMPRKPLVQVAASKDLLCTVDEEDNLNCFGRGQTAGPVVSRLPYILPLVS